jgi:hypothetical protein
LQLRQQYNPISTENNGDLNGVAVRRPLTLMARRAAPPVLAPPRESEIADRAIRRALDALDQVKFAHARTTTSRLVELTVVAASEFRVASSRNAELTCVTPTVSGIDFVRTKTLTAADTG